MTEKGARAAEVARLNREQASFLEQLAEFEGEQPHGRPLADQSQAVARELEVEAEYLERKAPDSPVQPDPRPLREPLAETDQQVPPA